MAPWTEQAIRFIDGHVEEQPGLGAIEEASSRFCERSSDPPAVLCLIQILIFRLETELAPFQDSPPTAGQIIEIQGRRTPSKV
jgi:hypothetical protein